MKRFIHVIPALLIVMLIASCGSQSQGNEQSYKETKTMVLDILKTEDAQKVIQKASKKEEKGMKMLSTQDGKQIQLAVKDVLTDKKNNHFLEQLMTDPKFAGDFAKAIEKENKQLMKDLMKDPEYQKLLMNVMKNPEVAKMILDLMKSTKYRQMVMSVMQDSLQSPLFKVQLIDLMKKALEENSKPEKKGAKDQSKS